MTNLRLSPDLYGILEQYRIDARRHTRFSSTGEHLRRKKGQSLEFEDYKVYVPGDDTRHLDLRASTRVYGHPAMRDPSKWLVREFIAEEQLRLFISIDTHPTMHYPQKPASGWRRQTPVNVSKIQFALWLAEALTIIAVESADTVIWHPLFNNGQIDRSFAANRRESIDTAFNSIQTQLSADTLALNTEPLEQELKPAFIWIIISDFYFTDPDRITQFREWVLRAKRGHRWIILIDLDSWDYERAMLATGLRRIRGYNVTGRDERRIYSADTHMQDVLNRVNANKNKILDLSIEPHHCRWQSEFETLTDFQNFFVEWLQTNPELKTVFMRNA